MVPSNSDTRIPSDSNTRDPNVGPKPGIRSDFVGWLDPIGFVVGFFDLGTVKMILNYQY